ncbi:MAG: serine/threonine-protein kinase [Lachnospiraceae bacterium]|nr:serine/threonine-protein kinase [Lachnospiraceae bacterium]
MSEIIAGLYEKTEEIGSGGGGVVYLGRHIRLDKPVVLKYDRRTLKADTGTLRREVDLLKGLSHTYIPQVYDFVQENDAVYTVMDYIEGESLDKLIKRGAIPPQSTLIKWACQLLEALIYLHSRPPHGILHGDIKPANIMVRPNGDVCLIDYNIALALGEDGAVRVGYSRGYASPEHYGYSYSSEKRLRTVRDTKTTDGSVFSSVRDSKGRILLDVRSDIYSLGATLYHLVSGHKPSEKADEVATLSEDMCSPSVAEIILKAMKPSPDDRYQTADEMLNAFQDLYRNDKRVIRRKRIIGVTAASLGIVFLAGCCLAFIGLKQMEQQKNALVLAGYSEDALRKGDVNSAVELALEALPDGSILNAPVTSEAQKALALAVGVYDLSDDYQPFCSITLPSEPFHAGLSEDGKYLAAVCAYELGIYDVAAQKCKVSLKTQESALSDYIFTDDNTVVYAGDEGVTAYDIEDGTKKWTGVAATTLALSGDGKKVAAVNRSDTNFFVYDTLTGEEIYSGSFGKHHLPVAVNDLFADPEKEIFSLDENGSFLAASLDNGGLIIFDLLNEGGDIELMEETGYESFDGGFIGDYFAFTAKRSDGSDFEIINLKNGELTAEYHSDNEMILKTDKDTLYLADGGVLVRMSLPDFAQEEIAYVPQGCITDFACGSDHTAVADDSKHFTIFDKGGNQLQSKSVAEIPDFLDMAGKYALIAGMNGPDVIIMAVEDQENVKCFKYDPGYAHDEARISADKRTVVLFDINSMQIFDVSGRKLAGVIFPEPESIYDQQFIRTPDEGSYLEVKWYDGTVRDYSVVNGSIIREERHDSPNKDLFEEFVTEHYKVASSLHEAPVVYDNETGRQLAVLQEEAYLTYVTETGYGLMTEYISSAGERYGVLLNDRFEPVAVLPALCDVYDDTAYFDYKAGDIRESRLYSLTELKALGEEAVNRKERD